MRIIVDDVLEFWISPAYEDAQSSGESKGRREFYLSELLEWEKRGSAMRYLDPQGRLAWRATPSFLERLAEEEREAREDENDDDEYNDNDEE